jgi:hypothetical protein
MLPVAVTEASLTGQQDQTDPKTIRKENWLRCWELLRTENVGLVNWTFTNGCRN